MAEVAGARPVHEPDLADDLGEHPGRGGRDGAVELLQERTPRDFERLEFFCKAFQRRLGEPGAHPTDVAQPGLFRQSDQQRSDDALTIAAPEAVAADDHLDVAPVLLLAPLAASTSLLIGRRLTFRDDTLESVVAAMAHGSRARSRE